MNYSDLPNLRGLNASGAYGLIPEDVYLRKIETTDMPEDPMNIENHIRSLLVDFRPDAPFLESDMPRDPSDRGGGKHSTEILNLRHFAAITPDDPYLPDGVFLDQVFMERDPRGIATGPDMRKHYEQQLDRAAFIKLYNDDDYSVPETGINPVKMVENINSGFYQFKDRYKNFHDSEDGWQNGGIGNKGKPWTSEKKLENYTTDGTIMDLADAAQGNRRDATAKLSSDPSIGFRYTTPDHRFGIAHYGFTRVAQDKTDQSWNNNRGNSFQDHANMTLVDGTLMNKMLARLIVDLQGQRQTKQILAQETPFNDSGTQQMAKRKVSPDDIYKIMRIGGRASHAPDANQLFEGIYVNKYGNMPMNNNRRLAEKTEINHEILQAMDQAVRNTKTSGATPHGNLEARTRIEESGAHEGFLVEGRNARPAAKSKRSQTDERDRVEQTRHVSDNADKITMNYASFRPKETFRTNDKVDTQGFGAHSLQTQERGKNKKNARARTTSDNEYDIDQGRLDFGVYDKANKISARETLGRRQSALDTEEDPYGREVNEVDVKMFDISTL